MKNILSFLSACIVALFFALAPYSVAAHHSRTRFEPVPTPEMQRSYLLREATRKQLNEADIIGLLRMRKQALESYNAAVHTEEKQLIVDLYKRELFIVLNQGSIGSQVAFKR